MKRGKGHLVKFLRAHIIVAEILLSQCLVVAKEDKREVSKMAAIVHDR